MDDSETGSESGFQTAPTDPSDPGEKRDKTSHVTTLVYDSEEENEEAYDSDNSVDLLQPTQVQLTPKKFVCNTCITENVKSRVLHAPVYNTHPRHWV